LEEVGNGEDTMPKRIKTTYPGVFYREVKRIGGKGNERVYYVLFKKDGKVLEEKVGRQFADAMTAAKAAAYRSERIEGKRQSRKQVREAKVTAKKAAEKAEASRWTFDKLWESYKAQRPDLKGLVTDQNRYELHIKPAFGDSEPKDLLPLDLDRLRINLLKKKKPATVRNVMELLRRIINFGLKKQLCSGLSFAVTMPKVSNLKTEDLTPEQVQRLLEALGKDEDPEVADLVRLALFSGMRRGELFDLHWPDVDFDRGFISLRDPKGGQDQKVPMNDAARALLRARPRTESPYVFPGRGGKRRVDVSKTVRRIRAAAGLPKDFRPLHGLRHAFASMLASSGEVDLYTLQKLLTHKSPVMTQRYAHLRDESLKRASNVAGTLIEKAANSKKQATTQEQTA
jgi:integrase